MRFILLLLLILLLDSSAIANTHQTVNQCEKPINAAQIIATFQQQLKKELMGGLSKGATEAIDICQTKAQLIASELSKDGVIVGRASLKQRNHATVIPDWVQPQLEYYMRTERDNAQPRYVEIDAKRKGYVQPIYIQAPCLKCHGEYLAPAIKEKLTQFYPQDQAINYKQGQFRGVFWLETSL